MKTQMETTNEVLQSPAMAPFNPCALLSHNRSYGIDGEIMAIVVISAFLILIFLLIITPRLMKIRTSSRNSPPVSQNHGDVYQRNWNS
ncbi:hypothetical protein LXL04_036588 [Taraxacum kok-saghyz]